MNTVLYHRDGRIGRITLNRPDVFNAINDDLPVDLAAAVAEAEADRAVRVIVLTGAGKAFCAGYDLRHYAEQQEQPTFLQTESPWDPMKDYAFMHRNTERFMSLFRCHLPVLCQIQGYAVAGGSDIALCSDLLVMAEDAKIGYPPARVWGCPTTAMWVYRIGPARAKRMLFTGDIIDGREAARIGLVDRAVPAERLATEVEALADRISRVPRNQLMMHKLMINQVIENAGLRSTQMLATLFDGIARHDLEGQNFKRRAEAVGWKRAVKDRDDGSFDWTANQLFDQESDHDDSAQ